MLSARARPLLGLRSLWRARGFASSARALEETAGEWVVTPVPHRGVYRARGRDTYKLLQGLLTNDVKHVEDLAERLAVAQSTKEPIQMDVLYAGLLTPQGRMVADLFLYAEAPAEPQPSVLVDLDRRVAAEALELIKKFKLRSKCVLEELPDYRVGQVFFLPPVPRALRDYYVGGEGATPVPLWDETHTPPLWYQLFATASVGLPPPQEIGENALVAGRDPRSEGMQFRFLVDTSRVEMPPSFAQPGRGEELHTLHRIWQGVGEGVDDMVPDSSIPLEVNLDYMNGVDFRKGCYIGQELTSRTHHRGLVRKRLVPVLLESDGEASEPWASLGLGVTPVPVGTNVVPHRDAPEGARPRRLRPAGRIASSVGPYALALVRLDLVDPALGEAGAMGEEPPELRVDLPDATVRVRPSIPAFWPQTGTSDSH